jgi:uncharacterized protein YecT (DUF1311 family)
MKKIIILLWMFVFSLPVNAAVKQSELRNLERSIVAKEWPACVSPRSYYDQVYCSTKVYGLVDSALNKQYSKTIKRLTSNQVKQLKKVQISWIRSRDDKCAKVDNDGSVILNLGCSTSTTVESLYYLQQMDTYPSDFDMLISEYVNRN